jgi:hypothetical protein
VQPWSFIAIPDTQHLATPAKNLTGYFNGMRDWIAANIDTYNVKLVGHLGDIVHEYGDTASWDNAWAALGPLFDLNVPVLLMTHGNHDTNIAGQRTRNLTMYNSYLPLSLYTSKSWYGGSFQAGQAQNTYATFTVAGQDYLAFMLEFYPRQAVLDWVDGVAAANPAARILVFTHGYLAWDGQRDDWTHPNIYGPSHYFTQGTDDAHGGEEMWQDHFRTYPGMLGVFNGHYLDANIATRVDPGLHGNNVLQGFYNFQEAGDGGRGRVMLLTVDEDAGTIRHRVVRTDLGTFEVGPSYDVTHDIWGGLPVGFRDTGQVARDWLHRRVRVLARS